MPHFLLCKETIKKQNKTKTKGKYTEWRDHSTSTDVFKETEIKVDAFFSIIVPPKCHQTFARV